MKTIIRLVTIGATLALLAFPAVANSLATDAVAQDQCTDENKAAWYATFRETFKTDQQPKAYEAAKKYLTACASEDTQITQYLKKWVTAYEKEIRKVNFQKILYTDKNYPEAFKLGGEILKDEPDNVKILMDLGFAGYQNSTKNPPFNADALGYARKAIQLIESGKTLDSWTPFPNKDEALAFLTYYIALDTLQKGDAAAALPILIKAAKFESSLKKSPVTYDRIAFAYETGPYAKLESDYKTKFGGKDESPEQKLALENINQFVDRMIDAYARAVALSGADAAFANQKKAWNESLTNYYKFRFKSETGLPEMLAGILSKPLPPEPTLLTSLPVSAPAATPASGNGASATSTGTTPPATNTASNSGSTANPKPTTPATTTPTKPAGTKRPPR